MGFSIRRDDVKGILAALLFGALILTVFSRMVPHQGDSLVSLMWSELRSAVHLRL
jgi:hypothetical protein